VRGNCAWLGTFPIEPFVPRRRLRGGHAQTIASHLLNRHSRVPEPERVLVHVEADVQVLCLCHWQAERHRALTVVIVHGLEGSSDSQYVVGTANKAWAAGMNVVRMNVRNCGGTEKFAATLYHSGMSDDIDRVVRFFIDRDALSSVVLVGFSMGGNQVLKLVGEWGERHPLQVMAAAAICPAMDLGPSADAIHDASNRLYEWRFLLSLRSRMKRKLALFPNMMKVERWWWKSIRDFDDVLTAPAFGFRDASDYYDRASSSRVLDRIRMPTLIVHAKDDPFIRIAPSTYDKLAANACIRFYESDHGGHCGFLAEARGYDGRWAERQIIRFCEEAHNRVRPAISDPSINMVQRDKAKS
jgi:predicted alpha/beta-fold hydrolase